jgi:hypothetical protein
LTGSCVPLLQTFEKIKDEIFFSGARQVVFLGKRKSIKITGFHTGSTEGAGGKIKDILGQNLFLFALGFLTGKRNAV